MFRVMTLAGLMALAGSPVLADGPKPAVPEPVCTGEFGTSLNYESTPSAAARKALKAEKLVMVLHVSGNFEDPAFT